MVQAVGSAAEPYFLGYLGAGPLAGVSLVFPLVMLMITMSAGGVGGGVSSAVARALGAGKKEYAEAIATHAVVIGLIGATAFTTALLLGGPWLFAALGGEGEALEAAITYSNIVFAGAVGPWLFNMLASVARGTGNMLLPAVLGVAGVVLLLVVSPILIFGLGPVPALGVAGAGIGTVVPVGLTTLGLLAYFQSGHGMVRLRGTPLRRETFWEILRVAIPGAMNALMTNLTVVLLTGLVGPFGTLAVAGYGMGARLEYLLIPLIFSIGAALVALVGTNVGAGQIARARQIAWTGALVAGCLTEVVGLTAAIKPLLWASLFSDDPDVLAVSVAYLTTVGPVYGCFGIGLALYFASQGAGRPLGPLAAGATRLTTAAAGGWVVIHVLGAGLPGLFIAMAAALVAYAASMSLLVRATRWG